MKTRHALHANVDQFTVYPWEKETDYEFFLLYDPAVKWPDHPAFGTLLDEIYLRAGVERLITAKLPAARESAQARRKVELASLLGHAWLVHTRQGVVDDAATAQSYLLQRYPSFFDDCGYFEGFSFPYVRISLNKNHYKKSDDKNPLGITGQISQVLTCLHEHHYVEIKPGFNDRDGTHSKPGVTGKQTRFRPDTRLELLFNELPYIGSTTDAQVKPKPDIFKRPAQTKGKRSRKAVWTPFDFCPTCPRLIFNSRLVDQYNDFIQLQRLHVVGARSGTYIEPLGKGRLRAVDLSNVFIRNQYHVEDSRKITYGRMHGGFWQGMRSVSRHRIRINGQAVVILDYKAMILNIAAALHDAQLPRDPYDFDFGIGDRAKQFQRAMIKKCVIIAINCETRNQAYQAMRNEFAEQFATEYRLPFNKDIFNAIVDALTDRHPFLQDVFYHGCGKDIFMHDADIARDIIRRFLDVDRLVLPIHDGFVAQQDDKDFLEAAMRASWSDRFSTTIAIDQE